MKKTTLLFTILLFMVMASGIGVYTNFKLTECNEIIANQEDKINELANEHEEFCALKKELVKMYNDEDYNITWVDETGGATRRTYTMSYKTNDTFKFLGTKTKDKTISTI